MIESNCERDQRRPGVGNYNGSLDTQKREGSDQQFSLRFCRPGTVARALAMSEAGSVDCNRAVMFGSLIEEAADQDILDHCPITVQEDNRLPRSAGDVVKAHAIGRHK
jgi:hypothetical protein